MLKVFIFSLLLIISNTYSYINIKISNKFINLSNKKINKNTNINFLIWKGFSIPSKNYIEFGKSIIKSGIKNNLNINVTICDNNVLPIINNTILFGHSSGGYHCLNNNNDKILAKITYGSSPKSEYDNTIFKINNDYNIDTLNIIGKYDGFVSYDKLLDQKYYNIKNNITNNKLICTKSNHFCIVENKQTLLSKLLCMYDHRLDYNFNHMSNDVKNVIISYILYIINNSNKIYNSKYTNNLLTKNNIFEVYNYKHFLRTKPDMCKTYIYIDKINNNTYIKTKGLLGDMLLETLEYKCNENVKEVKTTLAWLLNKEKKIILFNYIKKGYKYFKLPYLIN